MLQKRIRARWCRIDGKSVGNLTTQGYPLPDNTNAGSRSTVSRVCVLRYCVFERYSSRQGRPKIAHRFNGGYGGLHVKQVPPGTTDHRRRTHSIPKRNSTQMQWKHVLSSLTGLGFYPPQPPTVETVGYYRSSLAGLRRAQITVHSNHGAFKLRRVRTQFRAKRRPVKTQKLRCGAAILLCM